MEVERDKTGLIANNILGRTNQIFENLLDSLKRHVVGVHGGGISRSRRGNKSLD
jgi:hypothetical protein